MGLGETPQHRAERLRRQSTTYPELSNADPSTVNEIDRRRRSEGRPPTSLGAAVESSWASPDLMARIRGGGVDADRSGTIDPNEYGLLNPALGASTSPFRQAEQQRFDEQQRINARVRNVTGGLEGPQAALPIIGGIGSIVDRFTGAPIRGALQDPNPVRGAVRGFNEPNVYAQSRNLPGVNRLPDEDILPFNLSIRDVTAGVADAVLDVGTLSAIVRPERLLAGLRSYRDITRNIPIGFSLEDVSRQGDDALEAARGDLLARLRDQVRARNLGQTGAEIREGRFGQFANLQDALAAGRSRGLSGQALDEFARSAIRTGPLSRGPGPAAIPGVARDAFYARIADDMLNGRITEADYLNRSTALTELLNGTRQLQPNELRNAAMVLGPEAADLLNRNAGDLAQSVRPRPRTTGAGGLPSTGTKLPSGVDTPNLRPRRGLSAAARREQEAIGNRLQAEAAQRVPQPLPTREFPRPTLAAGAGGDLPSTVSGPQIERFRGAAQGAQERAQALMRAGENQSVQFNRARTAQIAAANNMDASRLEAALPLSEWSARATPRTVGDRVRLFNAQRINNVLQETVGLDDTRLLDTARELLAGQDGALSDEVLGAVEYWLNGNRTILDGIGPEGASWLTNSVNTLRGDFADPFLNATLQRRANLATGLRLLGLDDRQVNVITNNLMRRELTRRFGGNIPQSITDALRRNAQEAFRLSHSDLTTGITRAKNTQFGLFDLGVFGQQTLAAVRYGTVQGVASMVDRVASFLGHPLSSIGDAGLPRRVRYALDGVDQSVTSAVTELGEGSLLSYVPALRGVDARISRVVDASTQFQFGTVLGSVRNSVYEGQLTISRLLGQDISDAAVRARAAGYANHITSFANSALKAGRAGTERRAFLSTAMTRAQIARVADMAKLLSPTAPADVRIAAATMIASQFVFMYGFGRWLNDQIGIEEFDANPLSSRSGQIKLANGVTISISPQRSFENAVVKSIDALREEDPAALRQAWGAWMLGRSSPAVRLPAGLARWGYEPGYGYRFGDLTAQGALRNALPVPPILELIASGEVGIDDPAAAAVRLPLEFGGLSTFDENSYAYEARMLRDAGIDPEGMSSADRLTALGEIGAISESDLRRRQELHELADRGDRQAQALLISYAERDHLSAIAADVGDDKRRYRDLRSEEKTKNRGARGVFTDIYDSFSDPEAKGDVLKNRYYELFDLATNDATGLLDSDALSSFIDEFRGQVGEADWNFLQDELRKVDPRDNPLEQELQQVVVDISNSGLWDITNKAWEDIQGSDIEGLQEAKGFDNYYDWYDTKFDETRQQLIELGYSPGTSLDEATRIMSTHPLVKARSEVKNLLEEQWAGQNVRSGLTDRAIEWGYYRTTVDERAAINATLSQ